MPLLNTMGMRDGANDAFGTGYNVMQIWERRLDAKTKITTPNSDLIYGMTFADLAETGPLVFEAPAKLQGILLDFWQRPIPEDGGKFFGDVGLPGPDAGAGGKFLILPPGYDRPVPEGYYVYRSATNNVFIFLRAFYSDPKDTSPAVNLLKQSLIYPLGKKDSAKPMTFHDASGRSLDMLPRSNAKAFDELKWLVDSEGADLAGPDWLGMLAGTRHRRGQAVHAGRGDPRHPRCGREDRLQDESRDRLRARHRRRRLSRLPRPALAQSRQRCSPHAGPRRRSILRWISRRAGAFATSTRARGSSPTIIRSARAWSR